jgi:hypothetical protein
MRAAGLRVRNGLVIASERSESRDLHLRRALLAVDAESFSPCARVPHLKRRRIKSDVADMGHPPNERGYGLALTFK